jgi:tetratricopeptide (TPR) repeat protein
MAEIVLVLIKLPNNPDAYKIIGNSAVKLGYVDRAIRCGMTLIEIDPLNSEGYSIVADSFMQVGRWADAVPMLEKELKYSYQNMKFHVYHNLGTVHEKLGNLAAAIEYHQAASDSSDNAALRAMSWEDAQRLQNILSSE